MMIIDAYKACKSECMDCPWCGNRISALTKDDHHPQCDWLVFMDEYITKLQKKNKPAPEWYNEDWSDK